MDVEAHQNLHDGQTSDCRSFGSKIHPSSQPRKISMGVMADSKANTTCGAMKGEGVIMPGTEMLTSNVGNFIGEKCKVEGAEASLNIKQIGYQKCSRISKASYQRRPASEAILQANQASCLLVSTDGRGKPDAVECAPAKNPVQLFSNQTSIFPSNNCNQNKFYGDTSKRKGKKSRTTERVEEFTFRTAQEILESDKTRPEDERNRTENRTENLRMKLWQILGTTSSPEAQHSGSQTGNMDEGSLPLGQHLNQMDDKLAKTRQNLDTIESADHTNKRPVTRSWIRKRASAKRHTEKGKSGPSSKDKENPQEKNIFSFEEKGSGRQDAFLTDGSSMSLKSQRKNSRIRSREICFPENDTADKLCPDTSEIDIPPHDGATFSRGNKMGGLVGCLSDHLTECPQTEKINQENYFNLSSTVNKIDQRGELEGSQNGSEQDYRSNPVVQNVAKSKDIFQGLTFQFQTPALSSSPSSTPKTDHKANDASSPASTERGFSLGSSRNLRTFHTLKPAYKRPRAQRLKDMEEIKDSIPRKAAFFVKENEMQEVSADSSSEERNFQRSHEGSSERHTAEKKNFMLHSIKRLCRHEGIKFNDSTPASLSSKGTRDSDWIQEASEQNQDGFERAVERLALELGKVKSKLKSVTSRKSSEILKSVGEEIHLQLQNVHSQIDTNTWKLTSLGKSKRKRLETRFEDQQNQLRLIYEKFTEEVNLHLQDCRSTVESLEADQIGIKGALEKQRAAHRKLLSQIEEAVEIQLSDAQRKITATQEMARGKLLQLKQVIAMCFKEDILN